MIRFTDLMLFLSSFIGYRHDTLQTLTYEQVASVASSMYGFDTYFYFIDFMICFTDLMIFLSLYVVSAMITD